MKMPPAITIVAMICIAALEAVAMITGHDGQFLVPVVSVLAYLGGYTHKAVTDNKTPELPMTAYPSSDRNNKPPG